MGKVPRDHMRDIFSGHLDNPVPWLREDKPDYVDRFLDGEKHEGRIMKKPNGKSEQGRRQGNK